MSEFRREVAICFNDWMVSHTDATLVMVAPRFSEQACREQVVKHSVDVCPRMFGFCYKVIEGCFTTGAENI
jgi:hypothetical protein